MQAGVAGTSRVSHACQHGLIRAATTSTSGTLNDLTTDLLLLFAMIRSVVKSFKVPGVEVVASRMSNEAALTRMIDSTPKKTWSYLTLVLMMANNNTSVFPRLAVIVNTARVSGDSGIREKFIDL